MKYPQHYRRLHSIKEIEAEKQYLRKSIKRQESILSENWEEIKKPFRFVNIVTSFAGFFLPAKKSRWIPLIMTGVQLAVAVAKKRRKSL